MKTTKQKPTPKRQKSKNITFTRDAFSPIQINALFDKAIIDTQAIIDNEEGIHSQEVVDEAKLEIERIRERRDMYNEALK
jgi:hypothetical protein